MAIYIFQYPYNQAMLTSGNVTFKRCSFIASSIVFVWRSREGPSREGGGGNSLI